MVDARHYVETITLLLNAGYRVKLFTNGEAADDKFLHGKLKRKVRTAIKRGKLKIADRPKTPEDLVREISDCNGIIAHRLHANIIAYSYKIPHIAISTNRKLDGFFNVTQRARFCLSAREATPTSIVEHLQNALKHGVSETHHREIMLATELDLNRLSKAVTSLKPEKAPPRPPTSEENGDDDGKVTMLRKHHSKVSKTTKLT